MTAPSGGGANVNLATLWIPVVPETSQIGPKSREAGEKAREGFKAGFGSTDDFGDQLFQGMIHGLNRSDLPQMFDPLINAISGKQALLIGVVSGAVSAGLDLVVHGVEDMVGAVEEGAKAVIDEVLHIGEEFEEIHKQLATYSTASGEALEHLEGTARQVFAGLDVDSKNLGETLGVLRQQFQGMSDDDLKKLTSNIIELGDRFGQLDPRQIAASMHVFGVANADVNQSLATLIENAREFGVSAQQMQSDLKDTAPILTDLGVNYNSAAEAIARIEQIGIPASRVMRGLARSASEIGKGDGDDLKKYILDVNAALKDMMEHGQTAQAEAMMDKIFGSRNWPQIQQSLGAIIDAINGVGSAGSNIDLEKLKNDTQTVQDKWRELRHDVENTFAPIGGGVEGMFGGELDKLKGWFDQNQPAIIDEVHKLSDEFIDALPGIKKFAAEAVADLGMFFDFMKTAGATTLGIMGGIVEATGWLFHNDSAKKFGDDMMTMADNMQKLDFTTLGRTLSDAINNGIKIDPQMLHDKAEEAAKLAFAGGKDLKIDINPTPEFPHGHYERPGDKPGDPSTSMGMSPGQQAAEMTRQAWEKSHPGQPVPPDLGWASTPPPEAPPPRNPPLGDNHVPWNRDSAPGSGGLGSPNARRDFTPGNPGEEGGKTHSKHDAGQRYAEKHGGRVPDHYQQWLDGKAPMPKELEPYYDDPDHPTPAAPPPPPAPGAPPLPYPAQPGEHQPPPPGLPPPPPSHDTRPPSIRFPGEPGTVGAPSDFAGQASVTTADNRDHDDKVAKHDDRQEKHDDWQERHDSDAEHAGPGGPIHAQTVDWTSPANSPSGPDTPTGPDQVLLTGKYDVLPTTSGAPGGIGAPHWPGYHAGKASKDPALEALERQGKLDDAQDTLDSAQDSKADADERVKDLTEKRDAAAKAVQTNLPADSMIRQQEETALRKANEDLTHAIHSQTRAQHELEKATRGLTEANMKDADKGSGGGKDQNAETLGKGLLSGMFEEMGFGDIFGKSPNEWGVTKLLGGLAQWGMQGLSNAMGGDEGGEGGSGGGSGGSGGGPASILGSIASGMFPGAKNPIVQTTPDANNPLGAARGAAPGPGGAPPAVTLAPDTHPGDPNGVVGPPTFHNMPVVPMQPGVHVASFQGYGGGDSGGSIGGGGDTGNYFGGERGGLTPGSPGGGSGGFFMPNYVSGAGGGGGVQTAGAYSPTGNYGGVRPGSQLAGFRGGGIPLVRRADGTITSSNAAWAHLIQRESAGVNQVQKVHDVNSGGNEAEGYFQITPQTWRSHGGAEFASNPLAASPEDQAAVAARILQANPSGGDWGAGLDGRENASELLAALAGSGINDDTTSDAGGTPGGRYPIPSFIGSGNYGAGGTGLSGGAFATSAPSGGPAGGFTPTGFSGFGADATGEPTMEQRWMRAIQSGAIGPNGELTPGTAGGSEQGLQTNTIRGRRILSALFPELQQIGGVRQDALKWHPQGLALDLMIPGQGGNNDPTTPQGLALGNQVNQFIQQNAGALGSDYTMWQQKDHYNHVHGNFGASGYPQDPNQRYFVPPGLMPHFDDGGGFEPMGGGRYAPGPYAGVGLSKTGPVKPDDWAGATPGLKHFMIDGWIAKAMKAEGVTDPRAFGALQDVISRESGIPGVRGTGDPNLVNMWDSNWAKGDPSVGLAQVTPGTLADPGNANLPGDPADPITNLRGALRHVKANGLNIWDVPEAQGQQIGYAQGGASFGDILDRRMDSINPNEPILNFGVDTMKAIWGTPLEWGKKRLGFESGGAYGPPLFSSEGPDFYGDAFKHNRQFAVPSKTNYQTPLNAQQEAQFRNWVSSVKAPFDVNASTVDYDMRGYWQSYGGKPPWAGRAGVDHFEDTFKTPYDTTFSAESKYATKENPFRWMGDRLIDGRSGNPIYGTNFENGGGPDPVSGTWDALKNAGKWLWDRITGPVPGLGPLGGVDNGMGVPKGFGSQDSHPAMLKIGEHVLTSEDVQAMGGQHAVYQFRQALHNHYDAGGGIGVGAGSMTGSDEYALGLGKRVLGPPMLHPQTPAAGPSTYGNKVLDYLGGHPDDHAGRTVAGTFSHALNRASLGLIPDVAHDFNVFNNWSQHSGSDQAWAAADTGLALLPFAGSIGRGIGAGARWAGDAASSLFRSSEGFKVAQGATNAGAAMAHGFTPAPMVGPSAAGGLLANEAKSGIQLGDEVFNTKFGSTNNTFKVVGMDANRVKLEDMYGGTWWEGLSSYAKKPTYDVSNMPMEMIDETQFAPDAPRLPPIYTVPRQATTNWAEDLHPFTQASNPFTAHQRKSIWDYTEDPVVNRLLREHAAGRDVSHFMTAGRERSYWQDMIQGLDSALDAAPRFSDDVVLHRGATASMFNNVPPEYAETLLGKPFSDAGYLSSSAGDIGWGGKYTLEMHVPAGSRGLYVGNTGDYGSESALSYFGDAEKEMLLPRNSTFVPTVVDRDAGGFSKSTILRGYLSQPENMPDIPHFDQGGHMGPDPVSGSVDAVKNLAKWLWHVTDRQVPELGPLSHLEMGGVPEGMGIPKEFGSGDSHPAMLKIGEHVLTPEDVQAMGGQDAVYKFRSQLHKHYDGGGGGENVSSSGGTGPGFFDYSFPNFSTMGTPGSPHQGTGVAPGPSQQQYYGGVSTSPSVSSSNFAQQSKQNFVSGIGGVLGSLGSDMNPRQWQGILREPEWQGVQHQHQPVHSVQPISYDHSINITGNTIADPSALAQQMQESQNSRFYTAAGGLPMSGIGSP